MYINIALINLIASYENKINIIQIKKVYEQISYQTKLGRYFTGPYCIHPIYNNL